MAMLTAPTKKVEEIVDFKLQPGPLGLFSQSHVCPPGQQVMHLFQPKPALATTDTGDNELLNEVSE